MGICGYASWIVTATLYLFDIVDPVGRLLLIVAGSATVGLSMYLERRSERWKNKGVFTNPPHSRSDDS